MGTIKTYLNNKVNELLGLKLPDKTMKKVVEMGFLKEQNRKGNESTSYFIKNNLIQKIVEEENPPTTSRGLPWNPTYSYKFNAFDIKTGLLQYKINTRFWGDKFKQKKVKRIENSNKFQVNRIKGTLPEEQYESIIPPIANTQIYLGITQLENQFEEFLNNSSKK